MTEDKTKKMPDKEIGKDDFQFHDVACSAEFSSDGCKFPEDDEEEEN